MRWMGAMKDIIVYYMYLACLGRCEGNGSNSSQITPWRPAVKSSRPPKNQTAHPAATLWLEVSKVAYESQIVAKYFECVPWLDWQRVYSQKQHTRQTLFMWWHPYDGKKTVQPPRRFFNCCSGALSSSSSTAMHSSCRLWREEEGHAKWPLQPPFLCFFW
jgi:hypothetical protein